MPTRDIATMCVGALLVAAAVLKLQQFAIGGASRLSLEASFTLLAAPAEIAIGCLLLIRRRSSYARWAALILFGGFLAVSLYKALSGVSACDCFGRFFVSPWSATGIDILAIGALLWRPLDETMRVRRVAIRVRSLSAFLIVAGAATALATPLVRHTATMLFASSIPMSVDPHDWVGTPFALGTGIDIGDKFNSGLWLVLLYRNDCAACQDARLHYTTLAAELAGRVGAPRVAMIDCARHATEGSDADATPMRGRLLRRGEAEWKIPTPASVLIDDGTVRSIFLGDNAHDVDLFRQIWGTN